MKLETTNEESGIAGLVPTKSFVKASQLLKKAVSENRMLAVTGNPGIGKSTVREIAVGRYAEKFERYIVIKPEASIVFSQADRTSSIIGMMIESLSDAKPARDIVKRISQLSQALKANRTNRVILVLDEAQDLSEKTLYGLKKLHELGGQFKEGAQFSILLFGKPSLNVKLADYELGYRIEQYQMLAMDREEMKAYLHNRKLKFQNQKLYDSFYQHTKGLPLAGKKTVDEILKIMRDRKLESDSAFSYFLSGDLSKQARDISISNNDISKYIFSKYKIRVDASTVHKANKGILNTNLADKIRDATQEMIDQKSRSSE